MSENHLEHKFLSVRQTCLSMENLHTVVQEFYRIIIKQELT